MVPIFRQDYVSRPTFVHPVPHKTFFLIRAITHYGQLSIPFDKSTAKEYRLFQFRSPLLSESRLMSFPRATEMFQFTGSPRNDLCIQSDTSCGWVSPFGNLRIKANLPAPRSLSQAITSFVACHRQGIHHMHIVT